MNGTTRNDDWLNLMDVSGPFLAEPVLEHAFPQGLDELDPFKRKTLRQAYDEWREALDLGDAQFPELHRAWIDLVLKKGLELDEDGKGETLRSGARMPKSASCRLPEYGITLTPDYAVVDDRHDDKPLMLIRIHDPEVKFDEPIRGDGWATTPADRMVHLCRATKTRLGLVTNGERWMLVDAPEGGITTYASWYSRLWAQEPITLQSFVALLSIRRFFVDASEQLPALFDESLKHQDEVTESLGEQVRRAVEVLIQALDRADVDRNRELLHGVEPAELYEAGLTVMMRLVFLLCAEERDLLLLGDERYEADYAISTLRMQLRGESEEILERRWDAWSRLLSVFRAVYGGIDHESLRMPALGGSLFDPDRFPFLEGRAKGTNWRLDEAKPLPIDNRTVLLLLEAIQTHRGRALSYRALDVEQIGYVYEGLLERTAVRAKEVTLDLDATKNADNPWVSLGEVESAKLDSAEALEELFCERLGSSVSRVRNDLNKAEDESAAERLLTACHGDQALRDRIRPYFHLLRTDRWGYPLVYPKGAFMVTTGSGRRETGTHYTPKSLTEAIVAETLTPVVYVGPAEGKPREEWVLKSPVELLDLKICDPAMGSGAFLVQVCRWLSERLVEAWARAEGQGKAIGAEGEVVEDIGKREPLTKDAEGRSIVAKRLIAERCLYGVDINPLAVELAKLSIWLVTLAKGRPFGFLDHNLKCGDSPLGIDRLEQLIELTMKPSQANTQMRVFGKNIRQAVDKALELRLRLREMPIRDILDVEMMASLDAEARAKMELPEHIADTFVGAVFAAKNSRDLEVRVSSLAVQADDAANGNQDARRALIERASHDLAKDAPDGRPRRPFHWPLEFPEVFQRENGGFDVIAGNPPFLGGTRISELFGDAYNSYLASSFGTGRKVDLCGFFFRRAFTLLRSNGLFGLLATNTISQGTTRKASLSVLLSLGGEIISADPSFKWPGGASVITSTVIMIRGSWGGQRRLKGRLVARINDLLEESDQEMYQPARLAENDGLCFTGSSILGIGFFISPELAQEFIAADQRNRDVVRPSMGGKELNNIIDVSFDRWIIDFYERDYADASSYSIPFCHVEEHVKPERLKKDPTKYPRLVKTWWKFWHSRQRLYEGIARTKINRVLARARVSDHHMIDFLPSSIVFTEQLVVFLLDDWASFGILQSSIHDQWARRYASTMKNDVRYMPTDCFETFPLPKANSELDTAGRRYHELRNLIKKEFQCGLTHTYNRFHDPADHSSRIQELREFHCKIDDAVMRAYNWDSINLDHDFHKVPYLQKNDCVRFTISETARLEVLQRLSELNRQRSQQEVSQGLHSNMATKTNSVNNQATQTGFDFGGALISERKKP